MLLHGNGEDSLVLHNQTGRPGRARPLRETRPYEHDGERIVRGQRWMQTVSDIFLGWTTILRTALPRPPVAGHEGPTSTRP